MGFDYDELENDMMGLGGAEEEEEENGRKKTEEKDSAKETKEDAVNAVMVGEVIVRGRSRRKA